MLHTGTKNLYMMFLYNMMMGHVFCSVTKNYIIAYYFCKTFQSTMLILQMLIDPEAYKLTTLYMYMHNLNVNTGLLKTLQKHSMMSLLGYVFNFNVLFS